MPASHRKQAYHGAAFQAAVATLFGHKDYRHDLVTTAEVAAKTNVGAGATVEFRLRGERLRGKVNRVTKRATVLVRCEAGHAEARRFSDGQSYRKFFIPVEDCRVVA